MFASLEDKEAGDEWWMVSGGVANFNKQRKAIFLSHTISVLDESMSGWKPRTTKTGGLPHLSFIMRKPVPLGTEFKAVADGEAGCLLGLEIQRGKEGMKNMQYSKRFRATSACSIRLSEMLQSDNNIRDWIDSNPKSLIIGDSWFSSVKTALGIGRKGKYVLEL